MYNKDFDGKTFKKNLVGLYDDKVLRMQVLYQVRELQQDDLESVLALAMKSWNYTYKEIFTKSFIEAYVKRAYKKESLLKILNHTKLGYSKFFVLVEKESHDLAGYAQIGYDNYWVTGKKNLPLRLFRIYLDPELLGKGLGKTLLEKVEEFVRQEGQQRYIVGVHEKNTIGLRFYEKRGFVPITKESGAEGEIYFEKNV